MGLAPEERTQVAVSGRMEALGSQPYSGSFWESHWRVLELPGGRRWSKYLGPECLLRARGGPGPVCAAGETNISALVELVFPGGFLALPALSWLSGAMTWLDYLSGTPSSINT